MTKDEALKLALEAFEIDTEVKVAYFDLWMCEAPEISATHERLKLRANEASHNQDLARKTAYAAIKEAMAQPDAGIYFQDAEGKNQVTVVAQPVGEAYTLADKVREALDRQSCPDAFMRTAWEAVVRHYTSPPQPEPELETECDPYDLCAGCKCKFSTEAAHGIKGGV